VLLLPSPPLPALYRQVFGNAAFRSQQRQVIEAAMRGQDCFVLMPTGGE
jgi:superfamily II DNA helicase RecQ